MAPPPRPWAGLLALHPGSAGRSTPAEAPCGHLGNSNPGAAGVGLRPGSPLGVGLPLGPEWPGAGFGHRRLCGAVLARRTPVPRVRQRRRAPACPRACSRVGRHPPPQKQTGRGTRPVWCSKANCNLRPASGEAPARPPQPPTTPTPSAREPPA